MSYSPPVQYGIHFVERENNYVVGFSIKNLTDTPVTLTRSCGSLYNISIKTKSGDILWEPDSISTQAFTSWVLEPSGKFTKHCTIPNEEDRDDEIESLVNNADVDEENAQNYIPYIEPKLDCIINVELTPPMQSNYFCTLTKQYDLRQTTYESAIDSEPPTENREPLKRKDNDLSMGGFY